MKRIVPVAVFTIVLAASVTTGFAYTKPTIWDKVAHRIVFQDQWPASPHGWIIGKALVMLSQSDRPQEAAYASRYLLPMLEGVTFNDVWGDADFAGGSVCDYYVPDYDEDDHHGFGSALFAYKNDTESFKTHPFYLYEDAAEEAQFRYDYAIRIALGGWGSDPRDLMAGWVVDTLGGQDDPQNGRWASGAAEIDAGGFTLVYNGITFVVPTRFGDGDTPGTVRTPASALADLFDFHSQSQVVVDPGSGDPALSTLLVPTQEVLDTRPEWLDERFGNADDVEIYSGYDGHGQAVYAAWTDDAGGVGSTCSGCLLATSVFGDDNCDGAATMLARFPVGSPAHAFFQLGWAIHLLEDVTTPVHTIRSSFTTFDVHNGVEAAADRVLGPNPTVYNGTVVEDALPAASVDALASLFPFPPFPIQSSTGEPTSCWTQPGDPIVEDPAYFKADWYLEAPTSSDQEGVAHRYVRESAERTNTFMDYIECLDGNPYHLDWDWNRMGFFTTYGLDLGIKSTAGLIRRFVEQTDVTAPAVTVTAPAAGAQIPHNAALTLGFGATDEQTGVASIDATIDNQATVGSQPVANGTTIDLLTAYPTPGTHTLAVKAEDFSHNVRTASVTFSIIVTTDSLKGDVSRFVASGAITQDEGTSLLRKLNAAAAYRSAGDCKDAASVLQSFISEVKALTGKKITAAAATTLIADAQYLLAHCP